MQLKSYDTYFVTLHHVHTLGAIYMAAEVSLSFRKNDDDHFLIILQE
jgi:hypothetical protein